MPTVGAASTRWRAACLSLVLHGLLLALLVAAGAQPPPSQATISRVVGIVLTPPPKTPLATATAHVTPRVTDASHAATAASDSFRLPHTADIDHRRLAALPAAGAPPAQLSNRLAAEPGRGSAPPGTPDLPVAPGRRGRPRIPGESPEAALAAARAASVPPLGEDFGRPIRLTLYGGSPALGRTFVFLIDRSQSMGGTGLGVLESCQAHLAGALAQLQPKNRYQLIAYNDRCAYLHPRGLTEVGPQSEQQVKTFLQNLAAIGGTDHVQGLLAALSLRPDVIFLLTDGGDPELSEANLRELRELSRGRTAIHCLQFGREAPILNEAAFRRLARETRGQYQFIPVAN